MLLAIDSGNTNIVFGLYENSKQITHWRLQNEPQRPADEYIVFLSQWMLLAGYRLEDISDVIISSVVPDALFHLKEMVKRHFKNNPIVIGESGINLGVTIKIDRPETLGADRLVNTWGAYRSYGGPLILIDFGTATTFDVIDGEGAYVGGVIAPGVNLSLKALYEAAAKLPPTAFARTDHVIATTTTTAIQAGCYWGYVGMIEGLCARTCEEYRTFHGDADFTIIATGGLASVFSKDLDLIQHVNESLTLDSLAEIYIWLQQGYNKSFLKKNE
ncbi:MAG: type III pantothenate kinase [Proteobacteria bacterium]|nr:type III pantothenate kinase [Pseudomonadota bacterium]